MILQANDPFALGESHLEGAARVPRSSKLNRRLNVTVCRKKRYTILEGSFDPGEKLTWGFLALVHTDFRFSEGNVGIIESQLEANTRAMKEPVLRIH